MRSYSLLGALVVVLLAMSLVAVFAQYPPAPTPIPHERVVALAQAAGAGAVSGNLVVGGMTVFYPNGYPAYIVEKSVMLRVCGSTGGCVYVTATLTQTGLGEYTYSFPLPSSVSGTVKIILQFNSLTDWYGTSYPTDDTVIGTYTLTSASSAAQGSSSAASGLPGRAAGNPNVMRTTEPLEQNVQPQANLLMVSLLVTLCFVGLALIAIPRRTPIR
jgi:hypothetical protein